jgi:anti-anti-sigma factor
MRLFGRRTQIDVTGGHLVVHFISQHILDPGDVGAIGKEIEGAIDRYRAQGVILDFSGVKQLSSQMFGTILQLQKYTQARNATLCVCAMTGNVLKAFKLCRLDKVVPLFATEDDAAK